MLNDPTEFCVHSLAHPHFLPRYLAHNWFQRATPLDLELPWFAYGAIDFLDHFLCRGMSVCEYGTGGSTLFFARRVSAVCSIEDNPVWFHLLSERLRQKHLTNVQILFHPFDFKNPAGFDQSSGTPCPTLPWFAYHLADLPRSGFLLTRLGRR